MKLLLVAILCLLMSCTPEEQASKEAFHPDDIQSFLISVDGKSDVFLKKGNQFEHETSGYFLAASKTNAWLKNLSQVERLKTDNPGIPVNQATSDAIELRLKNGSRYLYQGGSSGTSYYAFVKKFPADENTFSGLLFLKRASFLSLFPPARNLRIDELPIQSALSMQYDFNGKSLPLTDAQVQTVKDTFKDLKIVSYPYDGLVTDEVKETYFLGQRINGNVPGSLLIKTSSGSFTLIFAKPKAHDPLTYIHVKGRNEIYAVMIQKWPKLETLFGKM